MFHCSICKINLFFLLFWRSYEFLCDFKTNEPQHQKTKTPRHRDVETKKPRFQDSRNHDNELPNSNLYLLLPYTSLHCLFPATQAGSYINVKSISETYVTNCYFEKIVTMTSHFLKKLKVAWATMNAFRFFLLIVRQLWKGIFPCFRYLL